MEQLVNVNFELDADVKKSMEQACSEMGLSISEAFTVFATKVGREKRIPFEISLKPSYYESNIRQLENIVCQLENIVSDIKNEKTLFAENEPIDQDEDMYGPFDTVSEMMEALND